MNSKDTVYQIFNHLELSDIIKCSTVNKLLKEMCDLQYMRLFNNYENIPTKFFIKFSFKQMYITCYELDLFSKRFSDTNLVNFFSANKLNIIQKNIAKLPESIGQLSNLQELWLDDNQITELPESIGQLVNLQELWLDNNKITELPESIGQLINCNIAR